MRTVCDMTVSWIILRDIAAVRSVDRVARRNEHNNTTTRHTNGCNQ